MIKCIVGTKGSGKTKQLIEMVNKAVKEETGNIICIEKGQKLTYDINHDARLIDISEYNISGAEGVYGFICGIYAENYDISHIFIDGLYKLIGNTSSDVDNFIKKLEDFSAANNIQFTLTVSQEIENVPKSIEKYI